MERANISPAKFEALKSKMARLGVKETDIAERFIRSSGPGGQNVNKVSTGVYVRHLPTGIDVKCDSARSQALNRFLARRLLAQKIESMVLGAESEKRKRIEKIRRQKRKRSKRSREKMLAAKKIQSAKKELRRKVAIEDA